jgi:thioredoxin 1
MAILQIESAEQFRTATAAADVAVACFSAPWCGGCKLVAPQVEALAEQLSNLVCVLTRVLAEWSRVLLLTERCDAQRFVGVSADNMEPLIEELEVATFPTFRVYKSGKVLGEYTSSKFDKVEEFIRSHLATDGPEADADGDSAAPVVDGEVSMAEATTPPMSPVELSSDFVGEEEESISGNKKRSEREGEDVEEAQEPRSKKAKTEEDSATNDAVIDTDMMVAVGDQPIASAKMVTSASEDVEVAEEGEEMTPMDGHTSSESDAKVTETEGNPSIADEEMAAEGVDTVASDETEAAPADSAPLPNEGATEADAVQIVTIEMDTAATEDTSEAATIEDSAEVTTTEEVEAVAAMAEPSANEMEAAEDSMDEKSLEVLADDASADAAEEAAPAESSTENTSMDVDAVAASSDAFETEATKTTEDGTSMTEENAIAA